MNSSPLRPITNAPYRTVGERCAIIQEARENGVCKTADKHRIRPRLINKWTKKEKELQEKAKTNPNAKTVNKGKPIENPEIYHRALMLIQSRKSCNFPLKAKQLVDYVLSLDPDFHSANVDALFTWAYRLLKKPVDPNVGCTLPSHEVSTSNKLKRKRKEIEYSERHRKKIENTHRRKIRKIVITPTK